MQLPTYQFTNSNNVFKIWLIDLNKSLFRCLFKWGPHIRVLGGPIELHQSNALPSRGTIHKSLGYCKKKSLKMVHLVTTQLLLKDFKIGKSEKKKKSKWKFNKSLSRLWWWWWNPVVSTPIGRYICWWIHKSHWSNSVTYESNPF